MIVYNIPGVRWTAQATGLNTVLKRFYRKVDFSHQEVQEFTTGDTSIKFRVHTAQQSNSLRRYLEEESEIIQILLEEITSEDTFYDVGACYGPFSALVSKSSPGVTVHAFEPGADRQDWFLDTADLNGVSPTLHGVALSNKELEMELNDNGVLTEQDGNETVRLVNGDRYIRDEGLEPPTVVKIDVEGKELDVIQGMCESLSAHCRLLLCEVHRNSQGVDPSEVYDTLEKLGFSTELVGADREGSDYIHAWK